MEGWRLDKETVEVDEDERSRLFRDNELEPRIALVLPLCRDRDILRLDN